MSTNYIKLTIDTMESLPAEKQVEVYDFAKYLKKRTKSTVRKITKKASILKLVGIGKSGCSDISVNHDTYLYE